MTRLSDAEAELPPDGRCECGCRNVCLRNSWTIRVQCDTDCGCYPCPVCHPESFEDDWGPAEFTDATCRPVTLPSGETLPVLGGRVMDAQEAAALGEVVAATRRLIAAERPPEPGTDVLYERIEAARGELTWREAARLSGVRFSVLFRIGQGRMPGAQDLAAIETWLANNETTDTNGRQQ